MTHSASFSPPMERRRTLQMQQSPPVVFTVYFFGQNTRDTPLPQVESLLQFEKRSIHQVICSLFSYGQYATWPLRRLGFIPPSEAHPESFLRQVWQLVGMDDCERSPIPSILYYSVQPCLFHQSMLTSEILVASWATTGREDDLISSILHCFLDNRLPFCDNFTEWVFLINYCHSEML